TSRWTRSGRGRGSRRAPFPPTRCARSSRRRECWANAPRSRAAAQAARATGGGGGVAPRRESGRGVHAEGPAVRRERGAPGRGGTAGGGATPRLSQGMAAWVRGVHVPGCGGGGAGMVLKPEPFFEAVEDLRAGPPIVLLSARGRPFTHRDAVRFAVEAELTLLCGHYKDVDQRVADGLGAEELSVGDFVLSGG